MTADEFATYDAAYVLGALSPEDRQAFEQHLQECDRCAAAVRELAGLPGLLAQTRGGSPGGALGPGNGEGDGAEPPRDPGPVPDLVIVAGADLPDLPARDVPGLGPDVAGSPKPGPDLPAGSPVPDSWSVPGADLPVSGSQSPDAAGSRSVRGSDLPVADPAGSRSLPDRLAMPAAPGPDVPGLPVPGTRLGAPPGPEPKPGSDVPARNVPWPDVPGSQRPAADAAGSHSVPDLSAVPPMSAGSDSVPELGLSAAPPMPGSQAMPDLLPVLMRKVRRRRRIRNGVTGGVAALAVAAGVALAVSLSLPDVSPPPAAPAVAAPVSPPELAMSALGEYPIQAAARIDPQSWGTEVEMSCSYRGGKGGDYSLVALGRDGTETQLATWKALPENTAKVVVGTPMKSQEIASLEIRSVRTGKPLMRLVYP